MKNSQIIYDRAVSAAALLPSGDTKNTSVSVIKKMKGNLNTIKRLGSEFLSDYNLAIASDETEQKIIVKYKLLTINEEITGSVQTLRNNAKMILSWIDTSNSFSNKFTEGFSNPFSSIYNWFYPTKTDSNKKDKFTSMPTSQALLNNHMIYDKNIRAYIKNIVDYNKSNGIKVEDPFIVLVGDVDKQHSNICETQNPLSTPICKTMMNSGDVDIVNKIKANAKSYCSKNFFDNDCNKYIVDNEESFKTIMHDIQKNALLKCISPAGQKDLNNCNPYPKLPNSKAWIVDNIKDDIQMNIDGTIKNISSGCGKDKTFTDDQCVSICSAYPTMCQQDMITKASDPNYRFATDKFSNKKIEAYHNNECGNVVNLYLLLLFILIIFISLIISNKKSCYNIGHSNKYNKLENN
jgi:hypothetical protein